MNKKTRKRKKYEKPLVSAREKVFETASLRCGKCDIGPFVQFACRALMKSS